MYFQAGFLSYCPLRGALAHCLLKLLSLKIELKKDGINCKIETTKGRIKNKKNEVKNNKNKVKNNKNEVKNKKKK